MPDHGWTWARLSEEQVQVLGHAERTLGADYLLAYENPGERPEGEAASAHFPAAPLDDGQLECLRGLEQQLGVVVVGYQKVD
jgi:hypothetical protein